MTIGDKIKKIRTFRNMTQAELGATLGWGDKGANRLAQYETNYRVPRKDLVTEMAKIPKSNSSDDTAIRCHDSDSWPAHPPVSLWFN